MSSDTVSQSASPGADGLIAAYLDMRGQLLRFLTARLGDPALAEDIYQDMYARLRGADPARPVQNVTAFLFRTAANLAYDMRRGRSRGELRDGQWLDATTSRLGSEIVEDLVEPEKAIDAKRQVATVVTAVQTLAPKCREAFVLHKFEGLSHAEVAARMGVSRKMIEKHISAALRVMAAALRPGDSE